MRKLTLNGINKVFLTHPDREVFALDNIDLSINEGEFIALIGPTGCGKTTLLRIIAGLENASSGEILLDGQPVADLNRISTLIFQQYSLFPWYNVIENITFPMEMKGLRKAERRRRAEELIQLVGLQGTEKAAPYELSGGMQQRVAIARALAHDPEVLLMDEPFGALDERTRHRLQTVLLEIWKRKGKTILFVTHNIDEALFLADRIIVMGTEPGRVVEDWHISLKRPRNRLADDFTQLHLKIRNVLEIT
ncbi:ABC transporter ATP-binding protein [bacterium]|nr:ABC transporter ATP-binding protein [bacterium]MBU1651069.1 ABC transporter ATP-binding protein [bacterium]